MSWLQPQGPGRCITVIYLLKHIAVCAASILYLLCLIHLSGGLSPGDLPEGMSSCLCPVALPIGGGMTHSLYGRDQLSWASWRREGPYYEQPPLMGI